MSFILKKILKKVDKLSLSVKLQPPQQQQCEELAESTHSEGSEDSLFSVTPSPPRSPQSRPSSVRFDRIDFCGLDSTLQSMKEKSPSPRSADNRSSNDINNESFFSVSTPRSALASSPSVYEKQQARDRDSPGRKSQKLTRTRSRAQQALDLHLRKLGLLHRCLREEIAQARLLLNDEQQETNATIALFQPLVQSLSARGLCVSAHTLYCVCVEVAQRVLDHLLGGLEGGAKDLSVVSKRLHKLAGALTDADSALCATRACVRSVLSAALGDDDDEESDGEGERAIAGISAEDMVRLESATAQLLVSVSLDVAKMASKQLPGPLCVEDLDARVSRALFAHDFEIDDVSVLGFKMNFSSVIERSKALYMDGINEH